MKGVTCLRIWLVPAARCMDHMCSWRTDIHDAGTEEALHQMAKAHAKRTGHEVRAASAEDITRYLARPDQQQQQQQSEAS